MNILKIIKSPFNKIFNSKYIKELFQEFLPKDKYLELKLQEICSQCPLGKNTGDNNSLSPVASQSINDCRMRYFGYLLQSFTGRPGDEETRFLYAYLQKCEECLLSDADEYSPLQEVVSKLHN